MLKITVPALEFWDAEKEEFVYTPNVTLELEHCLLSVSKWEAEFKKAFLDGQQKTPEEFRGYIKAMTMNDVPDEAYLALSQDDYTKIQEYIESEPTGTTFMDSSMKKGGGNSRYGPQKKTSSEELYYQMFSCGIPIECERWHLYRLMTLLRVFSVKNNTGDKKMSKRELAQRNAKLNKLRKAKLNIKG